jgi:bifunctional non-homologous end joining protein LigD
VPFDWVIEAARELRKRLNVFGLTSFCKTTGGKGLHVVAALAMEKNSPDWPAAKAFARELCRRMAADQPGRFNMTMAMKARRGRIYLDYLRNDRMATAVAPLSPRAREDPTVSMPADWPQVRGGLDPKKFTVRTAPALLRKNRPWKDYAQSAQPLRQAIERLLKKNQGET